MEVIIKTDRQQLEAIRDEFFPFMKMLVETDLQSHEPESSAWYKSIIVLCCFEQLQQEIELRLLGKGTQIELNQAQGITFQFLLNNCPVNTKYQWLNDLKDYLLTQLNSQIWTT